MDTKSEHECSFLTLNALLGLIVAFAIKNRYQTPAPQHKMLIAFTEKMQQLFIFSERYQLLPEHAVKEQLEQISRLYTGTQNDLFDLLYCCPAPVDAEHWFDYQQEYNARVEQMTNLTRLMHWHQQFYKQLLTAFPQLPIPFPTGYYAAPESIVAMAEISMNAEEKTDGQQIPPGPLPDMML